MTHRLLISLIVLCAITATGIWALSRQKISTNSNGENVSANSSIDSEIERLTREVKDRRHLAELWDTWNIRFLFIAGLAAILLVVSALGVSRSNRALLRVSDDLDKAKDRKLQSELKLKDDAIAAANQKAAEAEAKAEGFRSSIAEANKIADEAKEHAAQAGKAAEDERTARLKLEGQIAPRRLTDAQEQNIVTVCRPFTGRKVDVASYSLDVEAAVLAKQIVATLAAGGLNVDDATATTMPLGSFAIGIHVSGPKNDPLVSALSNAFSSAGLFTAPPNEPLPAGPAIGTGTTPDASTVVVLVGVRPIK